MSKNLFFTTIDIRKSTNKPINYTKWCDTYGSNSGNIVFISAIHKYLEIYDCEYDVCCDLSELKKLSTENQYDKLLIASANWINVRNKTFLNELNSVLSNIKIPIFFLGLGAQSCKNYKLDFLSSIKNETKSLIKTVLDSEGSFGLRGEFTAQCFDYLGFRNLYTVTGCPSVFQLGNGGFVRKKTVPRKYFKAVINGDMFLYKQNKLLKELSNVEFVEQDTLVKCVCYPDEVTRNEMIQILMLPKLAQTLIRNNRIKVFGDLKSWVSYLGLNNYSFSYGTRVHGNITALLSGVPLKIEIIDSRTKELADFFSLPSINSEDSKKNKKDWLYEQYLTSDLSNFNYNYSINRDNFKNFISKYKLPMELPEHGILHDSRPLLFSESNNSIYSRIDNLGSLEKLSIKKDSVKLNIKKRIKTILK